MNEDCVIIGAGHAAAQLCFSLRRNGWTKGIVLIGDEPRLPYHRPPLSKTALDPALEILPQWIRPESFYRDQNIEVITGEEVQLIDCAAQICHLPQRKISYGKLVLATGSVHRKFPIPGSDSDRIFRLRNFRDAECIRHQIIPGRSVVMVGAGYIGLELAASLRKAGLKVTVVELASRVLSRVTSPTVSDFFEKVHRGEGVTLRMETAVESIIEKKDGLNVVLTGGDSLHADFVVMGTGAAANTALAEAAGLDVDQGVLVDETCMSSDSNVYAVGDCARQLHPLYGRSLRLESVQNAVDQAKCAAAALCGTALPKVTVPWFWSDQYGVKLQTAGIGEGADQLILRGTAEPGHAFSVWYFKQRKFLAVDAVNDSAAYAVAGKLLKAGCHPDPDLLARPGMPLKEILKSALETSP